MLESRADRNLIIERNIGINVMRERKVKVGLANPEGMMLRYQKGCGRDDTAKLSLKHLYLELNEQQVQKMQNPHRQKMD